MKALFYSIFFAVAISVLFAGCTALGTSDDFELEDSFFENAEGLEIGVVSDGVVTIEQSQFGSYRFSEKSNEIINDSDSFESLWNDLHGNRNPLPELPKVDFSKFTVIVSMMGIQNSGGFSIEITKVAEVDNMIGIKIEEIEPGEGCFTTAALTSPFHIVKIPKRSGKEFQFATSRTAIDCETE